jgi:hypothetical protein
MHVSGQQLMGRAPVTFDSSDRVIARFAAARRRQLGSALSMRRLVPWRVRPSMGWIGGRHGWQGNCNQSHVRKESERATRCLQFSDAADPTERCC